jgi:SAM-dependent methyltransferase
MKTDKRIEEDKHWWFAGRTWSLLNMLDRIIAPDDHKRVLDVGCGAGNMIHHLTRYGQVIGVDNNPKPLAIAQQRGYDVRQGGAEALPVDGDAFDLVALLDTLEHCQDDMAVLRECRRACAPGGYLVVTTPAFMALWSHNDELNRHYRRYTASELRQKLTDAGFQVARLTHNNFLLFPPAAALMVLRRVMGRQPRLGSPHFDDESYQVEMEPAPLLLNAPLSAVTWTEAQVLRWINLPVGTSLICIARKVADEVEPPR